MDVEFLLPSNVSSFLSNECQSMNCATMVTDNIMIKKLILAEPDSLVVRIEVLISDVSITSYDNYDGNNSKHNVVLMS